MLESIICEGEEEGLFCSDDNGGSSTGTRTLLSIEQRTIVLRRDRGEVSQWF